MSKKHGSLLFALSIVLIIIAAMIIFKGGVAKEGIAFNIYLDELSNREDRSFAPTQIYRDRYNFASRGGYEDREAIESTPEPTKVPTPKPTVEPVPNQELLAVEGPRDLTASPIDGGNADPSLAKKQDELVEFAKEYLGTPYLWGGATPEGFDCSGFVFFVYNNFGYKLNRVAYDQTKNGVCVPRKDLQKGDLIFFGPSAREITHVGIYVGNNAFIHAVQTNTPLKITSLSESAYYDGRYITARRILK